jgi:hypothetical protein
MRWFLREKFLRENHLYAVHCTEHPSHVGHDTDDSGLPGITKYPRKVQWRLLVSGLNPGDAMMAGIAFVSYIVRFDLSIPLFKTRCCAFTLDLQTWSWFLVPLWLGIFALAGLYNRQNLLRHGSIPWFSIQQPLACSR